MTVQKEDTDKKRRSTSETELSPSVGVIGNNLFKKRFFGFVLLFGFLDVYVYIIFVKLRLELKCV